MTCPDMNKMPISRVPFVRTVLANRRNKHPVWEGDIADSQRLEQCREVFILRICFLHRSSVIPTRLDDRRATHGWERAPDLRLVQRVEGIHTRNTPVDPLGHSAGGGRRSWRREDRCDNAEFRRSIYTAGHRKKT
jgi:hypothetical protein